MKAGVQVCFVWLFTSIISACFRIGDCTPPDDISNSSQLILDPDLPCPLGQDPGSDPGPAVFAIIVFVLYTIPFLCCLCSLSQERVKDKLSEGGVEEAIIGWAVADYSESVPTWEAIVVLTKIFMVAGSVLMYEENRFLTHIITMGLVLLLLVILRPYKDPLSTVPAIAFTVGDLVGIVSAYPMTSTDAIQIAFIVMLLLVLLMVILIMLFSSCSRLRAVQSAANPGIRHQHNYTDHYSTGRKILMAPALVLYLATTKLAELLFCFHPCCRGHSKVDMGSPA